VLGLTLVVAAASKRYVEDPARTRPWRRPVLTPYRFAALGMSVVVVAALAQTRELDRRARADELAISARASDPCFAAGSLARKDRCPGRSDTDILPRPALATQDTAPTIQDHCRADEPFTVFKSCVYGDRDAKTRIALIGNSHAEQWLPALQQAFNGEPVAIETYVAGKCFVNPIPRVMATKQATDNCRAWSEWAVHEVTTRPFDLVVDSARTYGSPAEGPNSVRTFEAGYEDELSRLVDAGRKVLVIRDTPVPGLTGTVIPNCVAVHRGNLDKCAAPRGRWLNPDPLVAAARRVDQQSLWIANLTNLICRPDLCRPVEGGALVYMDHSHLTATYSRSLAPYLRAYVLRALRAETRSA
jgi:hypothetical protein